MAIFETHYSMAQKTEILQNKLKYKRLSYLKRLIESRTCDLPSRVVAFPITCTLWVTKRVGQISPIFRASTSFESSPVRHSDWFFWDSPNLDFKTVCKHRGLWRHDCDLQRPQFSNLYRQNSAAVDQSAASAHHVVHKRGSWVRQTGARHW